MFLQKHLTWFPIYIVHFLLFSCIFSSHVDLFFYSISPLFLRISWKLLLYQLCWNLHIFVFCRIFVLGGVQEWIFCAFFGHFVLFWVFIHFFPSCFEFMCSWRVPCVLCNILSLCMIFCYFTELLYNNLFLFDFCNVSASLFFSPTFRRFIWTHCFDFTFFYWSLSKSKSLFWHFWTKLIFLPCCQHAATHQPVYRSVHAKNKTIEGLAQRYPFMCPRSIAGMPLGASGVPYYCTPHVCVSDVIEVLVEWRHNKNKNKIIRGRAATSR